MKKLLENKLFMICIGSVLFLIIIFIVAILIISNKDKSIKDEDLVIAAKKYYEKNPALLPKENYDSTTIALSVLIGNGFISSEKEGASCPSYVMVTNMNKTYEYTPFIKCNTSVTPGTITTLMSKITSNMTNSGSGFYNENGSFLFKGENPNNYVKFGNSLWRIIGLDKNNSIKLIYSDIYIDYNEWDNRYNKDIQKNAGINDFISNENARIKEYLDTFFSTERNLKNFTAKDILKTVKFDTCIGKADISTGNMNLCENTVTSRISAITIDDYVKASLDESCTFDNTINCTNYNFLNSNGWTVTALNSNSYQAYVINSEKGLVAYDTYIRSAIRPVIALKNDVACVSGIGTQSDPYVIE